MMYRRYLVNSWTVTDCRVTGKASDEVTGSEESSDDQMRLSARNQVLSLTLQFLVCASDCTTRHKMAAFSQDIASAFQAKKKERSKSQKSFRDLASLFWKGALL